jgi:Xaa-Pro aminopeptidase
MSETIKIAAQAHEQVPTYLKPGMRAREVWSRMQAYFTARGYGVAYNPIITSRGEVLHGGVDDAPMADGELLLLDVGCEHPNGSASDISRTWSVSGVLSDTQSLIHQAVGLAQNAAIERCQVGEEYTQVHMSAMRSLTHSLMELGVFKGSLDALMEREVGAYFFPHGVGHLLGLDVHDMEDLGDVAGYAEGRQRSARRSLKYLRMNRTLERNMIVTIEPGFYQIPQLMDQARNNCPEMIDWRILAQFADVRGVRLEDDVLIEKTGPVVLSRHLHDAD